VSTVLVVWMGNVKEEYLKRELGKVQGTAAEANERASSIESASLQLRTDLENATAESLRRQTELEIEQRKTAEAQRETAEAQKAADEARLAIETQVRFQGPRSRFLQESRSAIVEGLKPYKGQSVIVVVCGAITIVDGEKTAFTNTLFNLLFGSPDSAGWSPNLRYDEGCTGSASLMVFVNQKASKPTRNAAHALAQELRAVPFTPRIAFEVDPNSPGALAARQMGFESDNSSMRILRDNQEAVVVVVGPHP
jgi:hypothetical protein